MSPGVGQPAARGGAGIVLAVVGLVLVAYALFRPRESGETKRPVPSAESASREPEPSELDLAQEDPGTGPGGGRWKRIPTQPTSEQQAEITELQDIGYASGSSAAPLRSGVTVHARERVWAGLNFYTSGHGAGAALMDMDGKILHVWKAPVSAVWPDETLTGRQLAWTQFWRRAHLFPNGDVLAVFEGHSLVKLDRDSNVLWKSRCGAHHDLAVLPDGDILVLTREAHVVPEFDPERAVLEDFVTLLDRDGREKRRFSLLEALDRSSFRELTAAARARRGDVLHTNSLEVLGEIQAPLPEVFRPGNLLVSSRTLSFVGVVDPEREELVWTMQGSFREQHDPQRLANGNLLLFDNNGRSEASSVLELDPASGRTVWEYRGTPEAPFYSRTCGTAQRLPNGNTLVTESDSGRAFELDSFELDRAGTIVWEFWNPERAGPEGEFIATLFEVVRLAPDFPLDWLR